MKLANKLITAAGILASLTGIVSGTFNIMAKDEIKLNGFPEYDKSILGYFTESNYNTMRKRRMEFLENLDSQSSNIAICSTMLALLSAGYLYKNKRKE